MAAPTLDQNAGNAGGGATSSATFNLSTSQNNCIICVCAYIENNGGAAPAITGITGASLTFASRKTQVGPTGGRSELWWASAPTALGSTTFTVTLAGSTDAIVLSCFGVLGCHSQSNPWDSNVSLPAGAQNGNTSWTPSLTGISTSQANDFLIMFVGADANFAGSTTVPTSFTSINKNAQGHFEFADLATAYQGVTSAQSNQTFTWGSGLTPDHSGQVIFDALTADAAVLGGVFFGATIS